MYIDKQYSDFNFRLVTKLQTVTLQMLLFTLLNFSGFFSLQLGKRKL